MTRSLGTTTWVIADGYIPSWSNGPNHSSRATRQPAFSTQEEADANVDIEIFFSDRDPVGPYRVTVPARRRKHVWFNDLSDPEPIPRDIDYASILMSDVPIVVQHTRLDSRQAENAVMSTIAYSAG